MEAVLSAAVWHIVLNLKQRALTVLIWLNREVKCVMAARSVRTELHAGCQAARPWPLRRGITYHRIGWQNHLKGLLAPLRARRRAGVVNVVALNHAKLPVVVIVSGQVFGDGDAIPLRGHVIDRDVAVSAALRRGD